MKEFAQRALIGGLAAITVLHAQPAQVNPPLYMAAESGDLAEVNRLLKTGADANIEGEGWGGQNQKISALQIAATKGNVEVVRALLDHGSDVNHRGYMDTTALLNAVSAGQLPTATLLLDRGANVEAKDAQMKMTPLHSAAMTGNLDMFNLLIAKGARLDAKAMGDTTPLMVAASFGNTSIVKRIIQIEPGAVRARNLVGLTTLDLVRLQQTGNDEDATKRKKELENILSSVH